MKKVLQITGSLRLGGLETVTSNYLRYKQSDSIQYTYLVYGEETGFFEPFIVNYGGEVVHISSPNQNIFSFIKDLNSVFINYGPFDAVHTHPSFNSAICLMIAAIRKVPLRISHSHTNRLSEPVSNIKQVYNTFMRFILQKFSTNIIACSEVAGTYLFGKHFFKLYGEVILNGIDMSRYFFNPDKRRYIRNKFDLENDVVLGHIGTLNDVKNQQFLIHILSKLKTSSRSYKLLLVGDGPNLESIKEQIKNNNLENMVKLVGQQSNSEDYLMAMDIFLFPSKLEGLGLAAVEAQVADLPVIISDQVPEEVISTNDCFRLPLDEELWINKIENIEIRSDRKGIYIEKFDVNETTKKTEKLYLKPYR